MTITKPTTKVKKYSLVPLLKSNLQKAVRLRKTDIALKTTKALIEKDEVQFLRRFPIIILEDVILHPAYYQLIGMLITRSKKGAEKLNIQQKDLIVNLVYQITECVVRDIEYETTSYKGVKISSLKSDKSKLTDNDLKNVQAIELREKYMGMNCDRRMLKWFAWKWSQRLSENKMKYHQLLETAFTRKRTIQYNNIPILAQQDILLESIDNHSSPLIKILLKKTWVVKLIKKYFPQDIEGTLKDIIWCLRSGINNRPDWITGEQVDWFINGGYYWEYKAGDKEKYTEIFEKIRGEIDNISRWYIKTIKNSLF